MKNLIKIIFIFFLFGISISGFSQAPKDGDIAETNKQTIELIINGERYPISNVNSNARVDVYNIIGSRVKSFEIRNGVSDTSLTLPKGYYIIKIDDTTRKIAVK